MKPFPPSRTENLIDPGYQGDFIRPPAEAGSIILQPTIGCPGATCTFCGAYRDVRFRVRSLEEFRAHVGYVAGIGGPSGLTPRRELAASVSGTRVFFGDGDSMVMPVRTILEWIAVTREVFPEARRFSLYAGPKGILSKSPEELRELKEAGLNTVYLGLESGSDEILEDRHKGCRVDEMILAVKKAQQEGLRASVMVLLGLGGPERSEEHAVKTAAALNEMQPKLLSVLTLMLVPGTPLYHDARKGLFKNLSARESLKELHLLVSRLELRRTVFSANHASSFLPLEGALPRDKEKILRLIEDGMSGKKPLVPDFFRGL